MKSAIIKHSVVGSTHKTSVSLEDQFWESLKQIADQANVPLGKLAEQIDQGRTRGNLSSAIRIFVLEYFRSRHARRASLDAPKLPPSKVLGRLRGV